MAKENIDFSGGSVKEFCAAVGGCIGSYTPI